MNLYIYAKSSHRDGLENVRRCAALAKELVEFKPTLCTEDYRAASMAKDELGVLRTMGIDGVANLRHAMERLDILIYDGAILDDEVFEQIEDYTSLFLKVKTSDIPATIVDKEFFTPIKIKRDYGIFFADDDYRNSFYDFCDGSKKHDIELLLGHYFFLGNEKRLSESFVNVQESEEYEDFIKSSKYLLCANVHSALESLACGNKPVFFMRKDKDIQNIELLEQYNIPIVKGDNLDMLIEDFYNTIENYPQTKKLENFDLSKIKTKIAEIFKQYEHLAPAIDYGLVSSIKE